jgi:hypothetical protein
LSFDLPLSLFAKSLLNILSDSILLSMVFNFDGATPLFYNSTSKLKKNPNYLINVYCDFSLTTFLS